MYSAQDIAKWLLCAVDSDSGDSITFKVTKIIILCTSMELSSFR